MKKVIILGGAFNPIHIAHISYAKILSNYADEVWLMTSQNHPFNKNLISFYHRMKMVELACVNQSKLIPSDFESRVKSNKTYDILMALNEEYKYNFYFAVGLDCANEIQNKWYKGKELIENFKFFVVARPEYFCNENSWFLKSPHIFFQHPINELNINSTDLRKNIKANKNLLNENVYDYILRNNLYD